MSLLKNIFFKDAKITTFGITRLTEKQIGEKVFYKKGNYQLDITKHHGMICLDPFCMAVWLSSDEINQLDPHSAAILFMSSNQLNAVIYVALIEKRETKQGEKKQKKNSNVNNYQLSALHRLVLFGHY